MSPGYGAQQPPSFWQQHWKWIVPFGCLGMVFVVFLFVGVIVGIVLGSMKSSEPAKFAYGTARDDPRVHAVLGAPVHQSFFVSGSVNNNGSTGSADLTVPISGPKGSGKLYVVAQKQAGQWQYQVLQLEVDGKFGRINLLNESALPAEGAATPTVTVPSTPAPVELPEPAAGGTYNTP